MRWGEVRVARWRRYRRKSDPLSGVIVLAVLLAMSWWVNNVGGLGSLFAVIIVAALAFFAIRWWFRQKAQERLAASGIYDVDRMTGEVFEEFLLSLFRSKGYRGSLTPKQADYGADLLLEKDGRKIVVQAKRWDTLVGVDAVQQVLGALRYYNAPTGIVITNSDFTENAYQLANKSPVELWNRTKLTEDLMASGGRAAFANQSPDTALASSSEDFRTCPTCGKALVKRSGRRGRFWGCAGYPDCRYTAESS